MPILAEGSGGSRIYKRGSKDEAPRSSAVGARIETPQAPRGIGCGEGCPFPTGERSEEGRCPSPEKYFDL